MPRSARVVIQPDDDAALEEKRPEPPASAALAVTGLEDPAISEDALAPGARAPVVALIWSGC